MNLLRRTPRSRNLFRRILSASACLAALGLASCSTVSKNGREIRVSVADQKAALYENGTPVRVYAVSTSKYGLGDSPSSNCTPIGKMRVAKKIGYNAPPGAVFKSRQRTGEILRPNAPGRDPVVTRILWLSGTEAQTRNAYRRFIYIHGTPEEVNIGRPASYGCVRMRSMDVIDLFNNVPEGTPVRIDKGRLPMSARNQPEYVYTPPVRPVEPLQHFGPLEAVAKQTAVASASVPKKTRKS